MLITLENQKHTFKSFNIIFDLDLTIYAKMAYVYLCKCANNKTNLSFPSYQDIADKCSCSRRKAIDAIAELKDMKLILKFHREEKKTCTVKGKKKTIKANTSNLYYIFPEPYTNEDLEYLENEMSTEIEVLPNEDTNFMPVNPPDSASTSAQYAPVPVHDTHSNSEKSLVVVVPTTKIEYLLKQYLGKDLTQSIIDRVNSYKDKFTDTIIEAAIEQAIEQGGNSLKYLLTILDSWVQKGISTMMDIKNDNAKHDLKRSEVKKKRELAKNNITVKKNNKAFTAMYSHNWDLDDLENKAAEYMERSLYGEL